MTATKTITKKGEAEQVKCYLHARQDWPHNGGSKSFVRMETRLQDGDMVPDRSFVIQMEAWEARVFAMELLATLDLMQLTRKATA